MDQPVLLLNKADKAISCSTSATKIIVLLSSFMFLYSCLEEYLFYPINGLNSQKIELIPIDKWLLFDYPEEIDRVGLFDEAYPDSNFEKKSRISFQENRRLEEKEVRTCWQGIFQYIVQPRVAGQSPLFFGKIRKGEIWRLITPAFLHANFLHLFFNMSWLWVLGRIIEKKMGTIRFIFLSLIIGVIANIAQYLVTGPLFLGYSAILVGMVAFIWKRQKIAPWEGYSVQRSTIFSLFFFVLATLGIDLLFLVLRYFNLLHYSSYFANTAHISGGIVGIVLARFSLFRELEK